MLFSPRLHFSLTHRDCTHWPFQQYIVFLFVKSYCPHMSKLLINSIYVILKSQTQDRQNHLSLIYVRLTSGHIIILPENIFSLKCWCINLINKITSPLITPWLSNTGSLSLTRHTWNCPPFLHYPCSLPSVLNTDLHTTSFIKAFLLFWSINIFILSKLIYIYLSQKFGKYKSI